MKCLFGRGFVGDRFVEVGDDDDADAEGAAVGEQVPAGGDERGFGLIPWGDRGERAGLLAPDTLIAALTFCFPDEEDSTVFCPMPRISHPLP